MSLPHTVEGKSQETKGTPMGQYKCRIPQRLPLGRQRPPVRNKTNADAKNKPAFRPRSNESTKSNIINDNTIQMIPNMTTRRSRPERERLLPALKKPLIHKRQQNDKTNEGPNKPGKHVLTVPLKQKTVSAKPPRSCLPDQETIKKYEELELQNEELSEAGQLYSDMKSLFLDSNEDSMSSRSDKITYLKNNWQEKNKQFQEMKNELYERQKNIMEVYATLRATKLKLVTLGQPAIMPSAEDLQVMNVTGMSPGQLLQLCAGKRDKRDENENSLTIDLKKLNDMPSKLVATCEQTLVKRKDFINWFQNFLNNPEKEYSKQKLIKKVNEFNEENEMINSSLQNCKNVFIKEINDYLRLYWNEAIRLQMHNEELTCTMSELNSQNKDLKKRIFNCEQQKSYLSKLRIEELEKELKEENIKRMTVKDRLSRAEGQVKIGEERSAQLETSLSHARKQTRSLERTIQQLQDQNQQLQQNFDEELMKLRESMQRNTLQLQEIAAAREALQSEKEELKKKLGELSENYSESINTMRQDLNKNIAKLIDVEKKYNDAMEDNINLQNILESQSAHIEESQVRYEEILQQLKELEASSSETMIFKAELETTKKDLEKANSDLVKHKNYISEQSKVIKEMECDYKKCHNLEENLKGEINKKEEHIAILENKQVILEQQLQESESKMKMYENQMTDLKEQIINLQENFGEFQNLNNLRELVDEQNIKLSKAKQEFNKTTEDIYLKRNELEQLEETLAEQEELINERKNILQILSEKEEEQANIMNLSQEIEEKNTEINTLVTHIETRKQQISQLEKIILTLEDQSRKTAIEKRKDHDKIRALEKKLRDYQCYIEDKINKSAHFENLDNLIKILEDEIEAPYETQLLATNESYSTYGDVQVLDKQKRYCDGHGPIQKDNIKTPTKIVMGNFVKKTYNIPNDTKYNCDNLDRKQAITNIDAQKWIPTPDAEDLMKLDENNLLCINVPNPVKYPAEKYLRNLHYTVPNQMRNAKKSKMFEFAGHPLP